MILKNLWYRRTRSLLTVLGIAIGVAAVVAFSAFGRGYAEGFDRALSSPNADMMVAQGDAASANMSVIDEEVGAVLRQMPGVREVTGSIAGVINMAGSPYFVVMGEDPRGGKMSHFRITSGRALAGQRQLLLGRLAAKTYHKQVGDTFKINDLTYQVVGIFETGVGLEEGGAVISLADAQRAFDRRGKVSYYNVWLSDTRRMDELKRQIEARWPDLSATRSGDPTRQSEMMALFGAFGWFLGLCAAVVGGLGMMNASLMGVFERTREIGVLRALGWKRRRIVALILGESLTLAALGGVLGVGLGLGLTAFVRLAPSVEALLQGTVTPTLLLQAAMTALLLGVLGGVLPAWWASRLAPIEAMRAEGGAAVRWGRAMGLLARLPGASVLRSLWRRPVRTFVTGAGICLGIAFVVMLTAVSDGIIGQFGRLATAGQIDLLAEQADASDLSFSTIDDAVAARLAREPGVRAVSRMVLGFPSTPGMSFFIVFGLDPREDYIGHFKIREGRAVAGSKEIMLGRLAANNLKKRVGDKLLISGSSFRVVGIYENGLAYEDAGGTLALGDAQQLFHRNRQSSLLGISLKDSSRAGEMARWLEARYPEVIVSEASAATSRMQDFSTLNTMLGVLVGLTLVVGGVLMMNSILMSVFERTQEIGVLRALGWRRWRVLRMVMLESLALSLLGALLGALLGVALAGLIRLEPTYGNSLVTPVYSWRLWGQTLLLALGLGALGGLYPAWRATALPPVEALRYE